MPGILATLKKKKDELLTNFANSGVGQKFTGSGIVKVADKVNDYVTGAAKSVKEWGGGQFGAALGNAAAANIVAQTNQRNLQQQIAQNQIIYNKMNQARQANNQAEVSRLKSILNNPTLNTDYGATARQQEREFKQGIADTKAGAVKTALAATSLPKLIASPISIAPPAAFGTVSSAISQKVQNQSQKIDWGQVGQDAANAAMLSQLWKANSAATDKVLSGDVANKFTRGLSGALSQKGTAATANTIKNLVSSGQPAKAVPYLFKIAAQGAGRGVAEAVPDNVTYSIFKKFNGDERSIPQIMLQDIAGDVAGNIVGNTIMPGGTLWEGVGAWKSASKNIQAFNAAADNLAKKLGHEGEMANQFKQLLQQKVAQNPDFTDRNGQLNITKATNFINEKINQSNTTPAPNAGINQARVNTTEIKPNPDLSAREKEVEATGIQRLLANPQGMMNEYQRRFGDVINVDNASELFPEYIKNQSENRVAINAPASKLTEWIMDQKLANPDPSKDRVVVFTAGGPASGKSTMASQIVNEQGYNPQFMLDSNLANPQVAQKLINKALAAGNNVRVVYTYADVNDAFRRSLTRAGKDGRVIGVNTFVKNHFDAPETVMKLAQAYQGNPNVDIVLMDNSGAKGQQHQITFDNLRQLLYNRGQYVDSRTESSIRPSNGERISQNGQDVFPTESTDASRNAAANSIQAAIANERNAGNLSDQVYRGLTRGLPPDSVNTPFIKISPSPEQSSDYLDSLAKSDVNGAQASPNTVVPPNTVKKEISAARKELRGIWNPLKNLDENVKAKFDAWRAKEISNKIEADNLAKQVDDLLGNPDPQTAWKLAQYIQDPTPQTAARLGLENPQRYEGAIRQIRGILDNLHLQAQSLKPKEELAYRQNYLPQLWQQSDEEIQQIAKSAGINAFYRNKRVIPDYQTGVSIGLTPKYTHPAQMIAEYYQKTLNGANNQHLILDGLINDGQLRGKGHPSDWVPIKSKTIRTLYNTIHAPAELRDALDKAFAKYGEQLPTDVEKAIMDSYGDTTVYAPKEIATVLDNIFDADTSKILSFTETANKRMQNLALSGGIPATPLNSFTIGQVIKEVTGGNFTAVRSLARSFSPQASEKFLIDHQPTIKSMAEQGINMDTGHDYKQEFENVLGGEQTVRQFVGNGFDKLFEEPTFKRFMPMKNIEYFESVYNGALRGGKTPEQAAKLAGDMTKSWMGLIDNYARNKKGQQLINSVFFAPSYREGMINFWNNLAHAIPNITAPENRQFLKFGVGVAITYGLMNAANYALTGHYMWDNKTGKKLSLEIPQNGIMGGEIGRSLFGGILPSVATMPRNAIEIGIALLQGDGDTVKQKFGSYFVMPIKLIYELSANTDYFGNPIRNADDSLGQQAADVAKYVAGDYLHPYAGAAVDLATGRRNPLESAMKVAELPLYGSRSSDTAQLSDKELQTYQNLARQGKNAQDYARTQEEIKQQKAELKKQKKAIESGKDPNAPGFLDRLFNSQAPDAVDADIFTPHSDPQLREAQRDLITDKLKTIPQNVSESELAFYYLDDIAQMPSDNRYENSKRNKALYAQYGKITDDKYLSGEQKQYLTSRIAQQLFPDATAEAGENYLKYYQIAKESVDDKTLYIYDDLERLGISGDHDSILRYLGENREKVNGKIIASDEVLNNLYTDGIISKAERDYLKKLDWDESTGWWKQTTKSGSGSGSSSKKSKNKSGKKFSSYLKISSPKGSTPLFKITAPKTNKINFAPIRIVTPGESGQPSIAVPNIDTQALFRIVRNR